MLKMAARGTKAGKPVHLVILGLSHMNLNRLKAGQPIPIDGSSLGLPAGTEILIFAGETERSMQRELHQLIGPETKVSIDPRLRD